MARWLRAVRAHNAKREYYLTDVVAIARQDGRPSRRWKRRPRNSRASTAAPNWPRPKRGCRRRLRAAAMEAGVSMTAPETVFLSHDTVLAPDVTIEPFVVFGPGVRVERGARSAAFSYLEGCIIGEGAMSARLRGCARAR